MKIFPPRGRLSWTDLYIVFRDSVENVKREPLIDAFRKAGLYFNFGVRKNLPLPDLPADIPVIMVGEKRGLPHPEPPYVFSVWKPVQPAGGL